MDEIALIDLANADPALDRRTYRCVGELRGGVGDLRVVRVDLRTRLIDEGALLIDLLAAGVVSADEVLVPRHVALRADQVGDVLRFCRLLLQQLSL